jgi:23S rRNA (cytosine1962-C5)-methyltransferase
MNTYPILKLKPGKEKSLQRRHPWVFSGALMQEIKKTPEGTLVNVCDINGSYLATGYAQHGSIAVRILSFDEETIDQKFWEKKIKESYEIRIKLGIAGSKETNCFRLMHGEGDGIPGLIVDVYASTAVIQCHSSGIFQHIEAIAEAIKSQMGNVINAIFNKSSETLHGAVVGAENGFLFGEQNEDVVLENGHRFMVDWQTGQKTGFFLDQRDNRQLLGHYAKDKTVLNTFSYTGGFSVYAMKAGAKEVVSIDVSKNAIDMLNRNMAVNNETASNYESHAEDTFNFFKKDEREYDIVVLDPPAFAKNIGSRHNALMGYKRLNIEGLKKVKKGGLLFTFSCSQVVDSHTFNQTIFSAAIESGRKIRIIHRLSQGADHPVNIYHPEGEYLKGLVLWVD